MAGGFSRTRLQALAEAVFEKDVNILVLDNSGNFNQPKCVFFPLITCDSHEFNVFVVARVQFKMVSMRSEKPVLCAPPRLANVSPTLPLKHAVPKFA